MVEGAGFTGALSFIHLKEVRIDMNGDKKRGRPKLENAKSNIVNARLSRTDLDLLLFATNESGDTYSEIMRKALRFYVQMMKNKV